MEEKSTMKTLSKTILAVGLLGLSVGANAALVNGSTLNIGSGSFWEIQTGTGLVATNITGLNGIRLGTSQTGAPDIDSPSTDFYGYIVTHSSSSPTNVLSASGNTASVDLSGWIWTWGGNNETMGSGAWDGNPNGVAQVICGTNCGNGDTYTLHYSATVPMASPSGIGGEQYRLTLNGTITAVPVPAAIWLLGSGLLGLLGLGRNKKPV
jgi:hypothetical protein